MGVPGLWNIVSPAATDVSLSSLSGSTVAVDISGWIVDSQTCGISYAVLKPYLRNLFFRVAYVLNLGVTPVFVFDGEAPLLKVNTLKSRNEKRFNKESKTDGRKRTLLSSMAKKCKELLGALGVAYVQAPGEAEATCGWLNGNEIVSGVISEDSDCLLYGARTVYKDFSVSVGNTTLTVYDYEILQSRLGLGRKSLIALALLLGCDYCDGVDGVGNQTAAKFVRSVPDDEILERINAWREDSNPSSTQDKLPHCSKCGHPGSKRTHGTKGCQLCITPRDCSEMDSDFQCSCDWHLEARAFSDLYLEEQVKQKAFKTLGFPFLEVQNEFLQAGSVTVSKSQLVWKEPDSGKLLRLLSAELGWEIDYCFEKLLPICTRWCVLNKGKGSLRPRKITKTRSVRFVACYEVEWEKVGIFLDFDKPLLTTEPKEMMKDAYSDLVDSYEQSKAKKPKKKVVSTKVKTPKLRKNIGRNKRISSYLNKHTQIEKVSPHSDSFTRRQSSPELTRPLRQLNLVTELNSFPVDQPKQSSFIQKTNQVGIDSSIDEISLLLEESVLICKKSHDIPPRPCRTVCTKESALSETSLVSCPSESSLDESIIVDLIVNHKPVKSRNVFCSPNAVSTPKVTKRVTEETSIIDAPGVPGFGSGKKDLVTTTTRTMVTPARPRFSLSFGDVWTPENKENEPERDGHSKRSETSFEFSFDSPLPLRERVLGKK